MVIPELRCIVAIKHLTLAGKAPEPSTGQVNGHRVMGILIVNENMICRVGAVIGIALDTHGTQPQLSLVHMTCPALAL